MGLFCIIPRLCTVVFCKRTAENHFADMGYPGRSKKKLEIIKSKWDDYYRCLQTDYEELGDTKQRKIEAHYIFPGQWIDLSCEACQRPFTTADDLIWKYQQLKNITSPPELLDLPPEFSITHSNKLQITNARAVFSGLYQCFRGNASLNAHLVEISDDANVEQVNQTEAGESHTTIMPLTNASTSTVWQNWTNCNACNKVGKRFRFGVCKVNYSPILNETSKLARVFQKFKDGLSCSSQFLLQELKQATYNFKHYVTTDYCKEDCPPKADKIEIDPKQINMEEISEALENIRSRMPEEESRILDALFGSRVLLQCPGALQKNIPVTWRIQDKELIPEIIQSETKGRVTIDFFQRLEIRSALPMDSNKYSCWQQDTLVGTIHVYIDKEDIQLDRNSMAITVTAIILITIIVAIRAINRRKRTGKRKANVREEVGNAEEQQHLMEEVEYEEEVVSGEEANEEYAVPDEEGGSLEEEEDDEDYEEERLY